MRLMEIMTTDVRVAGPTEDAEAAYQSMRTQRIHQLVVMDGRRVLGVLSAGDLGGRHGASVRRGRAVADLMSEQTVFARPTTTVREAANLLRARAIGCLPVVEDARLVGIVTITDLLELLGRGGQTAPKEISRWKAQHSSKWKPVKRTV